MQVCFCLALLLFVGVNADKLRIYNNPLNNKSVDLFLLVDETNAYMNQLQLGQIKIALNSIVTELQPIGSSPYFGAFFFGATSTVQAVVPFPTSTATAVKAKLDQKQYITAQSNPSTLSSALDSVNASCQSYCRANVPRVTVVFTCSPGQVPESRIRQLEQNHGMTVIAVGFCLFAPMPILDKLASYPSRIYAVPFDSFTELIVSAPYIGSLISNVPRLLLLGNTLSAPSTSSEVYYTVQLNTYGYIKSNDTVIIYTTNCITCRIYASLSEPNPTSANAIQNTNEQFFRPPGSVYGVYYFRVPTNTSRLFFSFVGDGFIGDGLSSVTGIFDVFTMPRMMSFS